MPVSSLNFPPKIKHNHSGIQCEVLLEPGKSDKQSFHLYKKLLPWKQLPGRFLTMDDLPMTAVFTKVHGKILLKSARKSLTAYLNGLEFQVPKTGKPPLSQNAGAFVTLWCRQLPPGIDPNLPGIRLRGCIGHIQADTPLFQIVPVMAVRAATADPRFPPMIEPELENTQIEISVLSPLRLIDNVSAIEVGKHGLFLQSGGRRGLLLPEVPVRRGWDREQFLQAVCLKANLPSDYWKNRHVKLAVFTTVVFEEP